MTMKNPNTNIDSNGKKIQYLARSNADTEAMNQLIAQAVISPEFSAAIVAMAFSQSGSIDQQTLMEQLRAQHAMHFIESTCFNKESH